MSDDMKKFSRRSLMVSVLRIGVGAAVVSFGCLVAAKRQRLIRQGKCKDVENCKSCRAFKDCSLPEAIKFRSEDGGRTL